MTTTEAIPFDAARERRTAAVASIAVFLIVFFLLSFFYLSLPSIPDTDSYYHLAVAREYATKGFVKGLSWARWSVMGTALGDKEVVFHVLLIPFVTLTDPATGGRVALAFFDALAAASVTWVAVRASGVWGAMLPFWLFGASVHFFSRMVRLRPEILSLAVLTLALDFARRRARVALFLASAVFVWSHIAYHVLPGLLILWCLWEWFRRRRVPWPELLVCCAGIAAGVLLHPHAWDNVKMWWIVNVVLFFTKRGTLDVGAEFTAPTLSSLLLHNAGWLAGLVVLLLATRRRATQEGESRPRADLYWIAGIAFLLLFIRMERMATWAIPLITLAVVVSLAERNLSIAPLLPRVRIPTVLVLGALSLLAVPTERSLLRRVAGAPAGYSHDADGERVGKVLPPGAKVAADWGLTDWCVFWAPQARYLNVLDPTLMALPFPDEYETQRRLFSGIEPDIPAALGRLDSEYLVVDNYALTDALRTRLDTEPRLETIYTGYTRVMRLRAPDATKFRFIRVWSGSAGTPRAVTTDFVDASEFDRADCVELSHRFVLDAPATMTWEFAPYGRAALRVDGTLRLEATRATLAMLGRGSELTASLEAGEHVITVQTCAATSFRINGFYLLERSRTPSGP